VWLSYLLVCLYVRVFMCVCLCLRVLHMYMCICVRVRVCPCTCICVLCLLVPHPLGAAACAGGKASGAAARPFGWMGPACRRNRTVCQISRIARASG